MKTIIAGSRTVTQMWLVEQAIYQSRFKISQVVSGTARGVDQLGERWAKHLDIPIKKFRPDWKKHGKSAGHIRNRAMGDYADALIAIWDGESTGTKGMIDYAKQKGLKIYVLKTQK